LGGGGWAVDASFGLAAALAAPVAAAMGSLLSPRFLPQTPHRVAGSVPRPAPPAGGGGAEGSKEFAEREEEEKEKEEEEAMDEDAMLRREAVAAAALAAASARAKLEKGVITKEEYVHTPLSRLALF